MADGWVGGWKGCGEGCLAGGGLVGVFDTQLAIVADGGALGIPKAHCRVSFLDRIPLSLSRSHFTSTTSPAR